MPEQTDHFHLPGSGGEPPAEDHRTWFDRFTQQMAIQRASANDTDAAIVDVQSYCADSGLSPKEAFGDPQRYATQLAAQLQSRQPAVDMRSLVVLLVTMQALALLIVGSVSLTQLRDEEVPVTIGKVLIVLVAVPAWVFLTKAPWARRQARHPATPDRPVFDERYWRALWLALGLFLIATALWAGLDQILFATSMFFFPALGLGVLALSILLRLLLLTRPPARP